MNNATKRQAARAAVCTIAMLVPLAGCSSVPRGSGIPGGATLVTETPDFKAGFTAPEDGTIYIFHRGDKSYLRYTGPILKGTVFTLDPEANAATIDTKPLEVTLPGGGNHYQVYFRPKSIETLDGMR